MSVRLNDRYLKNFISDEDYSSVKAKALTALETVLEGNGKGNDFLGWRKLPDVPDKEEFERIKLAAEKIKKSCDILLVIGIGVRPCSPYLFYGALQRRVFYRRKRHLQHEGAGISRLPRGKRESRDRQLDAVEKL